MSELPQNATVKNADSAVAHGERRPRGAASVKAPRKMASGTPVNSSRILLANPAPSLPVRERIARRDKLHAVLLDRSERAKKYQRLKSLSQRQQKHRAHFAALAQREQRDDCQRDRLRTLCANAAARAAEAVIERRRQAYVGSASEPESALEPTWRDVRLLTAKRISSQAVCAAALAILALTLLVAIVADFSPVHRAQTVAGILGPSTPHVQNVPAYHLPAAHTPTTPAAPVSTAVRVVRTEARAPVVGKPAHLAMRPQAKVTHPLIALALPQDVQAQTALLPLQKPAPLRLTAAATAFHRRAPAASVFSTVFGESPSTSLPVETQHPNTTSGPVLLAASGTSTGRWTLSADGHWTLTVRAPMGMHNVQFRSSAGDLLPLEPSATLGDGAIVRLSKPQDVVITMSTSARMLRRRVAAPDEEAAAFSAAAQPVGPHLVTVGWTPLKSSNDIVGYKVYRSAGEGDVNQFIGEVSSEQASYRDDSVAAASRYRYVVAADTNAGDIHAATQTVATPTDLPATSVSELAGKGMFLYFSALERDRRYFRNFDPESVIGEAQKAGIRVIELRMARGTSFMAETPAARAWLDRLIDAASSADIRLVAWTVPRRVSSEDLAQSVAAAEYTTPNGNGFVGLALDLESGARYMGNGAKARRAMVDYIEAVRAAVGPHYLLIATVASPMMGHLSNADYPYAGIAQYADVMQPMEYWHYFDETAHHEYAHREVAGVAAATVLRTRALAGRDIPVDIAGQSIDLEGTGAPSGDEILWSLGAAKSVGALGETFFDWAGTQPDGWAAIQAFDW